MHMDLAKCIASFLEGSISFFPPTFSFTLKSTWSKNMQLRASLREFCFLNNKGGTVGKIWRSFLGVVKNNDLILGEFSPLIYPTVVFYSRLSSHNFHISWIRFFSPSPFLREIETKMLLALESKSLIAWVKLG